MLKLQTRAAQLTELMDDPACDPHRLRRTYARFTLVNRLIAGWGRVYRAHLRPRLAAHATARGASSPTPLRVLDLGCGGGDVLRHLVALAHADGFRLDALGVDPDPRAIAFARTCGPGCAQRSHRPPATAESPAPASALRFAQATSAELVARGERYDIVISNHVLHHLDDAERAAFLADSVRLLERSGVAIHSDIARGRLAYLAYAVAAPFVSAGTFLYIDGLRSIRRSFTPAELRQELGGPAPAQGFRWRVQQPSRFRLQLIANAPDDPEAVVA